MSGRGRVRRGRNRRRAGGRGGRIVGRKVDRLLPGDTKAGLMSIGSQGKPFPDRWIADFRWSFKLSVTDPDTFSDRVFSGNSCFDPGISFSSTQPTNFDQFAVLYQKYRVIKSRIEVEFLGSNTTPGNPTREMQIAIVPGNVSTAFSNMQDAIAAPYVKHQVVANTTPKKTTNMMHSSKINGLSNVEFDPGQAALVTASPSDEWFWHVNIVESLAGTSVDADFQITIIYTTEWFDRLNQPLSTLAEKAVAQAVDWKEYLEMKRTWESKLVLPGRLPKPTDRDRLKEFVDAIKESKQEADEDKWLKLRKLDSQLSGYSSQRAQSAASSENKAQLGKLSLLTPTSTNSRSSSAK